MKLEWKYTISCSASLPLSLWVISNYLRNPDLQKHPSTLTFGRAVTHLLLAGYTLFWQGLDELIGNGDNNEGNQAVCINVGTWSLVFFYASSLYFIGICYDLLISFLYPLYPNIRIAKTVHRNTWMVSLGLTIAAFVESRDRMDHYNEKHDDGDSDGEHFCIFHPNGKNRFISISVFWLYMLAVMVGVGSSIFAMTRLSQGLNETYALRRRIIKQHLGFVIAYICVGIIALLWISIVDPRSHNPLRTSFIESDDKAFSTLFSVLMIGNPLLDALVWYNQMSFAEKRRKRNRRKGHNRVKARMEFLKTHSMRSKAAPATGTSISRNPHTSVSHSSQMSKKKPSMAKSLQTAKQLSLKNKSSSTAGSGLMGSKSYTAASVIPEDSLDEFGLDTPMNASGTMRAVHKRKPSMAESMVNAVAALAGVGKEELEDPVQTVFDDPAFLQALEAEPDDLDDCDDEELLADSEKTISDALRKEIVLSMINGIRQAVQLAHRQNEESPMNLTIPSWEDFPKTLDESATMKKGTKKRFNRLTGFRKDSYSELVNEPSLGPIPRDRTNKKYDEYKDDFDGRNDAGSAWTRGPSHGTSGIFGGFGATLRGQKIRSTAVNKFTVQRPQKKAKKDSKGSSSKDTSDNKRKDTHRSRLAGGLSSIATYEEAMHNLFQWSGGFTEAAAEFTDYAPHVFRMLRTQVYGISDEEYLQSIKLLDEKDWLSQCNFSEGKSGAFFFLTLDSKYFIKSLREIDEAPTLLRMLPNYVDHFRDYPYSLINKYFGFHGVTIHGTTLYFVVMNNIFVPGYLPHERYDLKGSFVRRVTHHHTDIGEVMKDRDFRKKVSLPESQVRGLWRQLKVDTAFLSNQKVMDYSLMLGIYNVGIHSSHLYSQDWVFAPLYDTLQTSRYQAPIIQQAQKLGPSAPKVSVDIHGSATLKSMTPPEDLLKCLTPAQSLNARPKKLAVPSKTDKVPAAVAAAMTIPSTTQPSSSTTAASTPISSAASSARATTGESRFGRKKKPLPKAPTKIAVSGLMEPTDTMRSISPSAGAPTPVPSDVLASGQSTMRYGDMKGKERDTTRTTHALLLEALKGTSKQNLGLSPRLEMSQMTAASASKSGPGIHSLLIAPDAQQQNTKFEEMGRSMGNGPMMSIRSERTGEEIHPDWMDTVSLADGTGLRSGLGTRSSSFVSGVETVTTDPTSGPSDSTSTIASHLREQSDSLTEAVHDTRNFERWKEAVHGKKGKELKKKKQALITGNSDMRMVQTHDSTLQAHIIEGPGFYCLGIIDILQDWNVFKRFERFYKVQLFCEDGDGLSCIEPRLYRRRFLAKMMDIGLGPSIVDSAPDATNDIPIGISHSLGPVIEEDNTIQRKKDV